MDRRETFEVEFSLRWNSLYGGHQDKYFIGNIDLWRDIIPEKMKTALPQMGVGQIHKESFNPGILVPEYSDKHIISFSRSLLDTAQQGVMAKAQVGRYYPMGLAWKPLDSYSANLMPMRLLDVSDTEVVVDTNHPLASYSLELEGSVVQKKDIGVQRGGSLQHITEILTSNGPGMQIPLNPESFYEEIAYPFTRENDGDDQVFYQTPRLVQHLDSLAESLVRSFYGRLLKPGARVLDLMGSWQSHIPQSHASCSVIGLGLNEEELKSNERLDKYVIHDLNKDPRLPLDDHSIDAVICTVSIEYLCRPREIMTELVRIIRPGGLFAVTVSERWFPGKEIHAWSDLHPFERQGLVLNYFLNEPGFQNLRTESIRGYPRPSDDKYALQSSSSDSLYMVWAQRIESQ